VEQTARWTTGKIVAITDLERHTTEYMRKRLPKIYSGDLVSLIFKLPYCRISSLVDAGIAQRQTASSYLKQLVEAGVLAEVESGKEKLFVHPKLYDLLTTENNAFKLYEEATPS
jgi:Fic family protein